MVWALVSLSLKDDFMSFRHAWRDVQGVFGRVVYNLLSTAMRALLRDNLSSPAAFVTSRVDNMYGEDGRRKDAR